VEYRKERAVGAEGTRLKELRDGQELTQEQLAYQSGIERDKIAKIETGTRRMSASDALYLSDALGVPMEDLVGRLGGNVHFRLSDPSREPEARAIAAWFETYIKDMLFLERSAKRHGVL
jgi:transcriptional regulator with XRE-family HTH domain